VQVTQRSLLLDTVNIVLECFGRDEAFQHSFAPFIVEISETTFAFLNRVCISFVFLLWVLFSAEQSENALVENPDIVEDYFRMAEKTLFFAPNLVLKTPVCAPAVQVREKEEEERGGGGGFAKI
jgi:hypothetical protein